MRKLTYANVTATLALVVAVAGVTVGRGGDHADAGSGATITGRQIVDRSLTGRDLKLDTLTGSQIRESRLNKVPRARNADRLGGVPAASYRVHCPVGTRAVSGTCFETQIRSPRPYSSAAADCEFTGRPPGRHLPSHDELMTAIGEPGITLAPGGELTRNVGPPSSADRRLEVIYITDNSGNVAVVPDTAAGAKAFRCVSNPLN